MAVGRGGKMKNAPVQDTNKSAAGTANYTLGKLPNRKNTVTADVLASMLESKAITGTESVFKRTTTRLSAVIYYLEHEYGWHIERRDIATGTNDGRVTTISAYWLPQAVIARAFEAGARTWIESVKEERSKRRKESDKCKAVAAKLNAVRKIDPRQESLWEFLP